MPDFAIIDSHFHLMDPSRFYYRWLAEAPPLNRTFSPEDYAAARKGVNVEGAVFMEVWVGDDERIAEVDWVTDFAAKNPIIKAILAGILLEDPERARRDIEELKRRPLVRGVRKVTEPDPPGYTLTPGFLRVDALPWQAPTDQRHCRAQHSDQRGRGVGPSVPRHTVRP